MRLKYHITYNSRATNFDATVTFAAMGKYVTDFLSYFKRTKGFIVTKRDANEGDSLMVHVPDATKGALIAAMATMPNEAFGWFVLACPPSAMTKGGLAQIWPDGMGGFSSESRASVEAVRQAADVYINQTR